MNIFGLSLVSKTGIAVLSVWAGAMLCDTAVAAPAMSVSPPAGPPTTSVTVSGTGFSASEALSLEKALRGRKADRCPFDQMNRAHQSRALWVKPELVVEVEHRGRSSDGLLRQAAFVGQRTDGGALFGVTLLLPALQLSLPGVAYRFGPSTSSN